jgi:hypothetical protein
MPMPRRARLTYAGCALHLIRAATNGGYALGGERFQREIAAATGRRTWRGLPGRPAKEPADNRRDGFL